MEDRAVAVMVREFDPYRDREAAEVVDRICEVGPSGKVTLFTDLLGDPVSRVRHSPAFLMLVAETVGPATEIVGLIRGCVKTVTCGKRPQHGCGGGGVGGGATTTQHHTAAAAPICTKVGYILGLRVSPCYRRMGIGLKLVMAVEDWFREKGAKYAYMATDKDNEASVRLFTERCGYSKFRTPSILVHPVFAHRAPASRATSLIRLAPSDAELLYRRRFGYVEFFPRDIDAVLRNPLSLGTFLAVPSSYIWGGIEAFLANPPESWAVLSVWNCKDVFRLEVRGAGRFWKGLAWASRVADRAMPWLRIPSMPDLFHPFGVYFLYGIGGEGRAAAAMVRALCAHARNMARGAGGVGVVAAEVASMEPLREGIPHWRRLSCAEDLWCLKRLGEGYSDGAVGDWTKAPPGTSIFVDPREI